MSIQRSKFLLEARNGNDGYQASVSLQNTDMPCVCAFRMKVSTPLLNVLGFTLSARTNLDFQMARRLSKHASNPLRYLSDDSVC